MNGDTADDASEHVRACLYDQSNLIHLRMSEDTVSILLSCHMRTAVIRQSARAPDGMLILGKS